MKDMTNDTRMWEGREGGREGVREEGRGKPRLRVEVEV